MSPSVSGCFCLNEVIMVDVDVINHFEESCEAMNFSSFFHRGPPKVIENLSNAVFFAMFISDKSGSPFVDFFNVINIFLGIWVPGCRCVI